MNRYILLDLAEFSYHLKGQEARKRIKEIKNRRKDNFYQYVADISEMIKEDDKRKFFKKPCNQKYIRKETIRLTTRGSKHPQTNYQYQYYIPNDKFYVDTKNYKRYPYYYFNLRSENHDLSMYDYMTMTNSEMIWEHLRPPYIEFLQKYYNLDSNQLPFFPFIYGLDKQKGMLHFMRISMTTKENLSSLDFSIDLYIDRYYDIREEYSHQYLTNNLRKTSTFNCYFSGGTIYHASGLKYLEKKCIMAGGVLIHSIILKVPDPPDILLLEEIDTKIQIPIDKTFQYNDIALYMITYDPIKQINESLNNLCKYKILNNLTKIPPDVNLENELYGIHLLINNPLLSNDGLYVINFH